MGKRGGEGRDGEARGRRERWRSEGEKGGGEARGRRGRWRSEGEKGEREKGGGEGRDGEGDLNVVANDEYHLVHVAIRGFQ